MKLLYRSRTLLSGLQLPSAIKCIIALANLRYGRSSSNFTISYYKSKTKLKAQVRSEHLRSDIQTILELAALDYYHLAKMNWNPDIIIDAGGNTGLFTLAACTRWPSSEITCYEPMPENIEIIKKHLELNGFLNRVKLIPAAIGDSNRKSKFFIRDANRGSLDNALEYGDSIEVNVKHFWEDYQSIRGKKVLIKFDIEGAEFEVLRDFFKHVPLNQLAMVMEVHGNTQFQNELLQEAIKAGLMGNFWEQSHETAHLFLATEDVGMIMNP